MRTGQDVQDNYVLLLWAIALDQKRSEDEAVSKLRSAYQHRTSQSYGFRDDGQRGVGVDPRLESRRGNENLMKTYSKDSLAIQSANSFAFYSA